MVSIIYTLDEKTGKMKPILFSTMFPEDGGWQGEWYHKIIWKIQAIIKTLHSCGRTEQ